ncbi:hypothetical protein BYT27DRAFT_7250966 [Phlegmacium glaucopus]|nr:hypothetical protein BYT27DRAFT_7250966 [Phlegmacium glaucopus]
MALGSLLQQRQRAILVESVVCDSSCDWAFKSNRARLFILQQPRHRIAMFGSTVNDRLGSAVEVIADDEGKQVGEDEGRIDQSPADRPLVVGEKPVGARHYGSRASVRLVRRSGQVQMGIWPSRSVTALSYGPISTLVCQRSPRVIGIVEVLSSESWPESFAFHFEWTRYSNHVLNYDLAVSRSDNLMDEGISTKTRDNRKVEL